MKKSILMLLGLAALAACKPAPADTLSQVNRADFQTTVDGKATDLYTLTNANGLELTVTNFGGRIVELFVPDKNGVFADVVLGHDHINKYINIEGERFLGATIGRYGNRIAKGTFTLDDVVYNLPKNDNGNTLHGGTKSFDMVAWDAQQDGPGKITFRLLSPDGDQGFPGNLNVTMVYELKDDNSLVITHEATTDKNCPVNLTHHSFFNLHGYGEADINDHVISIKASGFTPVDEKLIPLGFVQPVEGTPMDFRTPTAIGARVNEDFEQLRFGAGYDHNWVLDKTQEGALELAATVWEPQSGRYMEVFTTEPALQFYGGNFFNGKTIGKGRALNYRASLAMETQHYPDSPNQPAFPSTILHPGEIGRAHV